MFVFNGIVWVCFVPISMSEKKKNTLVIIDGNAIIHRSYHALPPLTTKDGRMVNAVYGFASMLLRVLKELQPTHLAVCFDLKGPTFRHKLTETYKATRVAADQDLYDQIPIIHELVEAFNVPIITKEGFEADDCIGTLVERCGKQPAETDIIIVTGDMDALQLVDNHVFVQTMRKGISDIVLFDRVAVAKRYDGLTPEQVVDYKALAGDASDNIKGVRGIGPKTAIALIKEYGALDALYTAAQDPNSAIPPSARKKLLEHKTDAYLSQQLATIRRDVPIECTMSTFARRPAHEEKIIALLQSLEFTSLLYRIPGMSKTIAAQAQTRAHAKKNNVKEVGEDDLPSVLEKMKKAGTVALQVHASSSDFLDAQILGVILVTERQSWYVATTLAQWHRVLHLDEVLYVGHNLKRDVAMLLRVVLTPPTHLFDTMVGSYLLNSDGRSHDLPALALKYLGVRIEIETQDSLFGRPKESIGTELQYVLSIAQDLRKEMQEAVLWHLYEKIEAPLLRVLARMELQGIAIDIPLLKKLAEQTDKRIAELTEQIYKEAGKEFNINSSNQLRDILFDTLQLPSFDIKKGKTGYSTAASELEKLHGLHPIIEHIETHRELMKLKTTYIDVLPALMHPKTNRVHTSFNQTVTATGRLSSSDPNMQNIPIRTEEGRKIRDAFIAEKGNMLIAADYSQIELRIVASLANDSEMIRIFQNGEDIHRSTAAKIHGVPLEKVTPDMRRSAKEINFGVLYGMGAFGLASRTGISRGEAQTFIDKYFEAFSGVKKYVDETIALAKTHGYVETLFGRRRYIPEIGVGNFQLRSAAERMAVNHPIQGTAADLMKLAMIALDTEICDHHDGLVRMLLQVHDELIFEVKESHAEQFASIAKKAMEDVVKLRVPVEVHVGIGKSWGTAK